MGVAPLVLPFVGERYPARRLDDLIAPPYDVLLPAERDAFARRHAHNIVHLILPENGPERYARAAARYAAWRAGGVLVADRSASLYVLQQEFTLADGTRRVRTGVIGGVAVEPFGAGRVRPHERTHAGPTADRLALLEATGAMFETLFMLVRDDDGELAARIGKATAKRPAAVGELQGVTVTLWRVPQARGRALAGAAGRASLYLADGHHRYETAVAYAAARPGAGRVPALIVPVGDPGLVVLATHRLVHGAPLERARIVAALRDRFQMRELPPELNYREELTALRGRGTGCVLVLPEGPALALLLRGTAQEREFAGEPAVASLDVARVDDLVVRRLLAHAGAEARLAYTPVFDRVIDDVRRGHAVAGVLLNPTPVAAVLAVADAGAAMPQKSTFFYPKVPSGLVVMRYA